MKDYKGQPVTYEALCDVILEYLTGEREYSYENKRGHIDCRYRDERGNACAIGSFVKDEDYHPEMEGASPFNLVVYTRLDLKEVSKKEYFQVVISDLQRIHDLCADNQWSLAKLVYGSLSAINTPSYAKIGEILDNNTREEL